MSDITIYTNKDGETRRFDADKATELSEHTWWDGHNMVGRNGQFDHERLYLTQKKKWVLYESSNWQGTTPTARELDEDEAFAWLLMNEYDDTDALGDKDIEMRYEKFLAEKTD